MLSGGASGAAELRLGVEALLLALAGVAAYTDSRWGIIPNRATFGALAIAPLLHGALGGFGALVGSLFGLLVCALVPLLLWSRGGMAGGDVKAFAAFGALGGVGLGLEVQFLTFIVASTYALGQLAWTGRSSRGFARRCWSRSARCFRGAIVGRSPRRS